MLTLTEYMQRSHEPEYMTFLVFTVVVLSQVKYNNGRIQTLKIDEIRRGGLRIKV